MKAALPSMLDNAVPVLPTHPLDFVLQNTESTFLRVGETLSLAVGNLNDLRKDFARLDATLGAESTERFIALTAETGRQTVAIAEEFARFEARARILRSAVSAMRSEVTDLMATIRAISIVKLQARIIGNMLTSSRQRVEAFTGGLTRMAAEAADLVAEVDEAMVEIASETDAMDLEATHLSQTLREVVLPNLAAIGASAADVQHDRHLLAQGNVALAARMDAIFAEVSQIILALQTGDSSRQRLEHVRHITTVAMETDTAQGVPRARAALLDLAEGLTTGAVRLLTADLASASDRFGAVKGSAAAAIGTARSLYLEGPQKGGGAIGAMSGQADGVVRGLARCGDHLRELAGHAARVAGHLETIRHHEERMRRIEDLVRLFGLNAVIVCAKLGQEGRALQEISRQLRDLTQVSAAVFTRLHGRLEDTQQRAAEIGAEAVAGLEQEMAGIAAGATELQDLLGKASAAHRETGHAFGKVGRILTASLETGEGLLIGYSRNLGSVGLFLDRVVRQREVLPPGPFAFPPGSPEAVLLDGVRAIYTTPEERQIHDGLCPTTGEAGMPPPNLPALPEAPVSDEAALDDIFF